MTGLENYATPLLYVVALATGIATWITALRFHNETELETPEGRNFVCAAILFAGSTAMGIAWFGATLMAPQTNHTWIVTLLWAVTTLAASIFCAKQPKQ